MFHVKHFGAAIRGRRGIGGMFHVKQFWGEERVAG